MTRRNLMHQAEQLAGDVFDAGARAVLRTVFANTPLRDNGIGGNLSDDEQEAVRYLRQAVWGRDAYDYRPRRKRPVMGRKLHTITRRAKAKREAQ